MDEQRHEGEDVVTARVRDARQVPRHRAPTFTLVASKP